VQKTCCAPGRSEDRFVAVENVEPSFARVTTGSLDGMKLIPGGEFVMGTDGAYGFAADGEGPAHPVALAPFHIDATCVTNEQFNTFVNATGHKTESERFGWSFVFFGHLSVAQRAKSVRASVLGSEWWCRVDGATWRHPEGPGSNIKQRWEHPVVHVSWSDARAYAAWIGKRLRTEAEWECAARGGLMQKRFPWGDELEPGGRHAMNVWQGVFPTKNTEADGHYGTAPAKHYRGNGYGLYQMTGNVWEWCSDWFDPAYYAVSPRDHPTGPASGERRVMRGARTCVTQATATDTARIPAAATRPTARRRIWGFAACVMCRWTFHPLAHARSHN
jgi:sulfatase modifying factor 1